MLEEAKSICDHLIVGLQTDPTFDRPWKNRPIQTIEERFIQLEAVKYVDEIILYTTESELVHLLLHISPDIRIIGQEYLGKDFTGKKECQDNGIAIYYNSRNHGYSSTELRERIIHEHSKTRQR